MELFENITRDIYNKITSHNHPSLIYLGVGTFAGIAFIDNNGRRILENKDYHQFPPTLQQIYKDNKNIHMYFILIDPIQEDPILMSTDTKLNHNLNDESFTSRWIRHFEPFYTNPNVSLEVYENDRIRVYPFRHYVCTDINKMDNSINITRYLDSLHKFCIRNNTTMVYHDFSGPDTYNSIAKHFKNDIKDHLDHIIYGFGNGNISGCYYDFTSKEAQLVYNIDTQKQKDDMRQIIRVFNINNMITDYNKKKSKNNMLTFNDYMMFYINKFGLNNLENITSQFENMMKKFNYNFKNHVIFLLRIIKNYNNAITTNDYTDVKSYEDLKYNYCLMQLHDDIKQRILELYSTNNRNIFNDVLDLLASYYHTELSILINNSNNEYCSPYELLVFITSDENKYNWGNVFDQIMG